jgi:hypothetical protein
MRSFQRLRFLSAALVAALAHHAQPAVSSAIDRQIFVNGAIIVKAHTNHHARP